MSLAPLKVFISYSHRDTAACERLLIHLEPLRRQGLIDAWHDRRIAPGEDLDDTISAELEGADVLVCLVSPDFLASNYCYTRELARALERREAGQCDIFPVIVTSCHWKPTPLGKLMALPRDGLPVAKHAHEDDAWLQVAEAIQARASRNGVAARPRPGPTMMSPTPISGTVASRSSNLSIRRRPTDADRHRFHRSGFEFMRRFFEESAAELTRRHPAIDVEVAAVDGETFTARAFLDGGAVTGCRIYVGGMFGGRAISYSSNPDGGNNVSNEQLTVDEDDQGHLGFRATGMAGFYRGGEQRLLTQHGAAEMFWGMFMEPLQR